MTEQLIILNFAEARQPIFREKKGEKGGYIEFGEGNSYPNYLLDMFKNSAKNNAIIRSKVNYVIGNGWKPKDQDLIAEKFIEQPNKYESLADLTRKVSTDIEVFGGAYIEVIWSAFGGQVAEVCHIDYTKIRSNKDNTSFWYKADWSDRKEEAKTIPAFNNKIRRGKQILYIKEYRPGLDTYALPGWIGALNYVESDIEISKHVLGNAQTGFSASKLITLPNGEPSDDEKRSITRQFENRFTGSDGKKFILSFVNDASRKPIIDDLGASDITKEDFSRVDTIIQQNIFAGHQIVSPMLFGIKTEGQLGGANEIRTAYEIFKNTYVNDKQRHLESIFNMLGSYYGLKSELTIVPVEPVGFELSEQALLQIAPKEWLLEKAGIDPTLYGIQPQGEAGVQQSVQVNDNLKNLTGRQHQQLLRIIRQFGQGKITREIATTMLKSGLGMCDDDINTMLGVDEPAAFSIQTEDDVINLFSEFGESRNDYEIVKSRPLTFEDQFASDIVIDDTKDKQLIDLVSKDPKIPIKDIAKALRISEEMAQERVNRLQEMGVLEYIQKTGERRLKQPASKLVDKPATTTFLIRYSYEWKSIVPPGERDTAAHPSRAFCRKLMNMEQTEDGKTVSKLWSRQAIETLTARLGYSVFDRGGGWWGDSPSCRHEWRSNIVVKKNK
jgi:hypothetical protein